MLPSKKNLSRFFLTCDFNPKGKAYMENNTKADKLTKAAEVVCKQGMVPFATVARIAAIRSISGGAARCR